jgi:rhodanese-related sulfurtransferase
MAQVKLNTISPQSLAALLGADSGYELLDVRTPPEYATAHVPGARLIPLNELKTGAVLARHTPGTPVFVLCQSGARAQKAISQLERDGCDDCVLVDGGTQAWIDAGLPVHRGARSVLPLLRQVQIGVGSVSSAGAILALAVNPWFAAVPLFFGCGLLFAGITGHCGMALMLAKMPWNRGQSGCSHCCASE